MKNFSGLFLVLHVEEGLPFTGVQPIARWSMLGIVHNPSILHIEPRQGGKANLTNTFYGHVR